MEQKIFSEFLKLKKADFFFFLLLSVITAVFTAGYNLLATATSLDDFNWQPVVLAGIVAFVAYLTKNLFTNSDGQPLTPEK